MGSERLLGRLRAAENDQRSSAHAAHRATVRRGREPGVPRGRRSHWSGMVGRWRSHRVETVARKEARMLAALNHLLDAVEGTGGDHLDVAAVALAQGTTEHHLRRLFSSIAGMPVSEYLR